MASRPYDFTLAALLGASQRLDVRGSFCKLTSATGAVAVKADNGDEWALLPGQGFRLPESRPFQALTVRNLTAGANVGVLVIGDSYFEDSRITGRVSIVDDFSESILSYAYSNVAITGYIATAMILPAANLNGLIVRTVALSVRAGAGGITTIGVVAARSAPTGSIAPSQRFNFMSAYENTGTLIDRSQHFNKQVPPGWGVYVTAEIATSNAITCSALAQIELL